MGSSCWLLASGVSSGRQDSGRSRHRQRVSRLRPGHWHRCGVLLLVVTIACDLLQENSSTSTWQADAFNPVAPFVVPNAAGRKIASKHTSFRLPCSPPSAFSLSRSLAESCLFSSIDDQSNESNDEDDGWDDDSSNDETTSTTTPYTSPTQLSSNSQQQQEPERDMFIPIFALVSVTGLFGAYAYETLRLASKGELYLPWNQ